VRDVHSLPFTLRSVAKERVAEANGVSDEGASAAEDADFDPDAAVDALSLAALRGDEEATLILARLALRLADRAEMVARCLEQASQSGSGEASHLLGLHRFRGIAGAADPVEARRLQTIAAEDGIPAAQFELSLLLAQGIGGPADPVVARYWEERAATAGHPRACLNQAARFAAAQPPDLPSALEWYRRAAEAGSADAAARLCRIYLGGEGAPRDEPLARGWFERASALGYPWPADGD